jgi:hypothetical protein
LRITRSAPSGDGDGDDHAAALRAALLLKRAQPTQFRIDFFGRLLADMAGVEDHQIGAFGRRRRRVAKRRQDIHHAVGVIDVHLAAVCFDVELLAHRQQPACRPGAYRVWLLPAKLLVNAVRSGFSVLFTLVIARIGPMKD